MITLLADHRAILVGPPVSTVILAGPAVYAVIGIVGQDCGGSCRPPPSSWLPATLSLLYCSAAVLCQVRQHSNRTTKCKLFHGGSGISVFHFLGIWR